LTNRKLVTYTGSVKIVGGMKLGTSTPTGAWRCVTWIS